MYPTRPWSSSTFEEDQSSAQLQPIMGFPMRRMILVQVQCDFLLVKPPKRPTECQKAVIQGIVEICCRQCVSFLSNTLIQWRKQVCLTSSKWEVFNAFYKRTPGSFLFQRFTKLQRLFCCSQVSSPYSQTSSIYHARGTVEINSSVFYYRAKEIKTSIFFSDNMFSLHGI